MHELLLLGQVPGKRVEQVLGVLAGFTASQPERIIERHVIYKPARSLPTQDVARGATQSIASSKTQQNNTAGKELSLLRLVKSLEEADFGTTKSDQDAHQGWKLLHWDVPEPAQKKAILRMTSDIPIVTDDPGQYMELMNHKQVSQLIIEGHRFVYGHVVLFLHKIRRFPDPLPEGLDGPLPPYRNTYPLDASNSCLLQATVQLSDGTNTDLLNRGLLELETIQARLKGVVDLQVPERLAFDTRVR